MRILIFMIATFGILGCQGRQITTDSVGVTEAVYEVDIKGDGKPAFGVTLEQIQEAVGRQITALEARLGKKATEAQIATELSKGTDFNGDNIPDTFFEAKAVGPVANAAPDLLSEPWKSMLAALLGAGGVMLANFTRRKLQDLRDMEPLAKV